MMPPVSSEGSLGVPESLYGGTPSAVISTVSVSAAVSSASSTSFSLTLAQVSMVPMTEEVLAGVAAVFMSIDMAFMPPS
jgi:hypothetical protein